MENYIEALKKVPEYHLKLVDLAWKHAKPDGTPDEDALVFNHIEVKEALKEAKQYTNDTKRAVIQLCSLLHLSPWEIGL